LRWRPELIGNRFFNPYGRRSHGEESWKSAKATRGKAKAAQDPQGEAQEEVGNEDLNLGGS